MPFFGPRYNIAPTQMAPVIFNDRPAAQGGPPLPGMPAVKLMRWGLVPAWAKDESVGNALINARSETLHTRTAFREAFKSRRCLVPADSFFEWQERDGKRQPFRVMLKSGEPFFFAGLWDKWIRPPSPENFDSDLEEAPPSETVYSFTIITRAANAAIKPLHDRMPLMFTAGNGERWLKADDPRCIEPVRIERDMFERQWWGDG